MHKIVVVAAVALMMSVPAFAETYKWMDEKGVLNFTDDYAKVPEKYLQRVQIIGNGGVPAAEVTSVEEVETKHTDNPSGTEQAPRKESPSNQQEKKKLYGGKDEDAWKSEFSAANKEIKAVEDQILEQKARLADSSKMRRPEYLGIESNIKTLESRLAERRQKLETLREVAVKADVPQEIRN